MKITDGLICSLQTKRGGYTKETLEGFGITWPPEQGWKNVIIGGNMSEERYERLLNHVATFNGKKKAKKNEQAKKNEFDLLPINIGVLIDHINKYFDPQARAYIKERI